MGEMTRRRFLLAGAQGMALAAVPLVFRIDPLAAFVTPDKTQRDLAEYYRHFGVDEKLVREIMAAALSKGGDYCDVYFQHSVGSTVVLEDNVVNRAYTSVNLGVGIRVLKGEQTGYSFTEALTPEAMKEAARTAANIASAGQGQVPGQFEFHPTPDYYPVDTHWSDVGIDAKIPYLMKVNDRILAGDPTVIKARVYFGDEDSYILLATSEGRVVCDYQPMVRLTGVCTGEKDGRRETGAFTVRNRADISSMTPEVLGVVSDRAVAQALKMYEAVKPDGGEMPVVLAAGGSGVLLHEAMGHPFEADFNRRGESIFAEKMGQPVAESFVSIADDGTNEGIGGSINVDDEGFDSQKTMLVTNGVLTSYLHDRLSSKHYDVAPTGSGRRQSFRYPPMPRMRNTYMLPGPHGRDEIISSVKKGIYVESFTNGEVRIGSGDFTFYVKTGNLIENGKLTTPVKDINLIGNGPDVLSKITMVADDFEMDRGGWMCGKSGQSVPVSLGMPTVLVSSITVGGVS